MAAPRAAGRRLPWPRVPERVRRAVETTLGAAIVEARTQEGGFSPGAAARLRLANGGRAFVKALGVDVQELGTGLYRAEAVAMAHLPAGLPAPRLLDVYDDGEWVALVFEDVDGRHPAIPWKPDELERVAAALADLGAALTPSPWPEAPAAPDANRAFVAAWRELAAAPPADLDPWLGRQLARLAAEGPDLAGLVAGDTLLHGDVRSDNLLLTPDGGVVLLDWAWTCNGAGWLDVVWFAETVNAEGGADADRLVRDHPLTRAVPAPWIDAAVLAAAAIRWRMSRQPAAPPHHRAYAEANLRWARRRIGPS
ncbi:MAG: aminoglycoside phosphotransferase family protein [Chloroflexi bacterium]|nr:MAG: aminoglycoside phosphotransferase family protein [Chloroflexota bacterium]